MCLRNRCVAIRKKKSMDNGCGVDLSQMPEWTKVIFVVGCVNVLFVVMAMLVHLTK
jgi:hypothetical protein